MSNFTPISSEYQHKAILQQSASQKLFDLLAIQTGDDVLDLGCGPGHLTHKIRDLTDGIVVGMDPSEGMISEAIKVYHDAGISFRVDGAESLDANDAFDVIFCNSALQWFYDRHRALANCHRALRSGGRLGIQAPARRRYCSAFVQATDALFSDPRTRTVFAYFHAPWFALETADAYARLCAAAGFLVKSCWIEQVPERLSPEKAFEMFESAPAAGYFNPDCYDVPLTPEYQEIGRQLVAVALRGMAGPDGLVPVTFARVYLLAFKT